MNKKEILEFIEEMDEIGDHWEFKDVERMYKDYTLEEAFNDRKSMLNMYFENIARIINMKG